jgi:hypothetical protein
MRRLLTWATAAVLPALLASGLMIGCSGENKSSESVSPSDSKESKKGGTTKGPLTAVEATGKGTVKGKIKLAGGPKDFASEDAKLLTQMKEKDDAHCVAGAKPEQLQQQHWRVGQDGGLANVFVWLAPPDGKFFKIEEKDITPEMKKDVVLDQPKCAFEPHAFVLFPKYRDPANPKEMKPTGQKLIVKNSNAVAHNTDLEGGDDNPAKNNQVSPGGALEPMVLNPSSKEIDIKCTIHQWMNAYARVFDHPYATVSGKDGSFEIKDVPAGAEVHLVVWHELGGFAKGTDRKGKVVTLKAGDNPNNDFEIEYKQP